MESSSGNKAERPFVGNAEEAKEEVEDLEGGNRLDSAVEILGEEVPENLGPEEAMDSSQNLV